MSAVKAAMESCCDVIKQGWATTGTRAELGTQASSFLWHASEATETIQRKSSNRILADQHMAPLFL